MLTSLACIFLMGMLLGRLFSRLGLPALLGMLFTGILLGPGGLDFLDGSLLSISADLRQIALVVILARAGLALRPRDLKRVGRPAVLMCFLPACLEIAGMVLIAPGLLGITYIEAAVMGSVVAAVSPAVIVPRMLRLMETGYGNGKSIPQLIMAGASVDDVFVIVLFSAFTSLAAGGPVSPGEFLRIPVSVVLGIVGGLATGLILSALLSRFAAGDTARMLTVLSAALLLVSLEKALQGILPFSGLLAVMAAGVAILRRAPALAAGLSAGFSRLWVAAELLLFALVGAAVDVGYALSAGPKAVALLLMVLLFRVAGVWLCLLGTALTRRERLFCMIAYLPKATVQAAIGGIPLAMGLPCGPLVLTVAVLSILVTAPLGAFGIDHTYTRLLTRE